MTKLQRIIATTSATAALLANTAMPLFAATELIIQGNGSDSTSAVQVANTSTTSVIQDNTTSVSNKVNIDANTGDNEVNDNTGGEVQVQTGDAEAMVEITNQLNTNVAEVENCGNCHGDTKVAVTGNGTDSENYVGLSDVNAVGLFQTNNASIDNDVEVDLQTGDNGAEDNTGGDVVVVTGDADATVKLHNQANTNSAVIAGGTGDAGDVELLINENGSETENVIELGLVRASLLTQANVTDLRNDVDVEAETGDNEADDNTGGEVAIGTGDVDFTAMVHNAAGFNYADIEGCCFEDIMGKVSGNGTDSENYLGASLDQVMEMFQNNACEGPCFDNEIDFEGETGDNEVEDSTASDDTDPLILTGDVDAEVEIDNMGGSNVYGEAAPESDWMGGMDLDIEISFDLGDLLEALGL